MDLLRCESKQYPLRLLYAFFNYVSLGQWQLARVCIRRLNEELDDGALILDEGKHVEVHNLLRTIVIYPHVIWRYSASIPSPYHLSWLCLTEYKLMVDVSERNIPTQFGELVELYLLLYTVEFELKIQNVWKEQVIAYYSNYIGSLNSPSTPLTHVETINEEVLSYLATILKSNRTIGDCIIQQLIVPDIPLYADNNVKLLGIYVSCIEGSVISLKETDLEDRNVVLETIYGILGVFDPPSVYQSKLRVGNLFLKLLQAEEFGLKRELTYNSIIGRNTPDLIRVFSEVEALQFESQYKEFDFLFKNSLLVEKRDLKWNNIFLHAFYHKTHALEDVLHRYFQFPEGLFKISPVSIYMNDSFQNNNNKQTNKQIKRINIFVKMCSIKIQVAYPILVDNCLELSQTYEFLTLIDRNRVKDVTITQFDKIIYSHCFNDNERAYIREERRKCVNRRAAGVSRRRRKTEDSTLTSDLGKLESEKSSLSEERMRLISEIESYKSMLEQGEIENTQFDAFDAFFGDIFNF
ncbi:Zinc finger FYVE domain-containing protein 26 [Oopsacas minuta]|uniref:Zinc finger FYVE domain-containing protein 26 n=1 Tax=Oopsacas minuta TaxID=111878 RepID=A0AAV7KDE9_9METZ|nr:Zinc finger FYVE domain-containing protein 26 [Oopsacas minuta]